MNRLLPRNIYTQPISFKYIGYRFKFTSPPLSLSPTPEYKFNLSHSVPYHEQYESRDNENETKNRIVNGQSYGEWFAAKSGPTTRIERQKKMKEFLDRFYSESVNKKINNHKENNSHGNYFTYDSEY